MKEFKKNATDFLSCLEGYHQTLKMLHWSATHNSLHNLCDDIDGNILEYEDSIAECVMGILSDRIGIGELKTLLPEAKTLDSLLKELQFDVIEYKKKVGDDMKMSGLQNILDDFIQNINKWNYLKTLV